MAAFFQTIYLDLLQYRYFYLVLLLLALAIGLTLHPGQRGADGTEYLRWTHSLIFDQDIHLLNDTETLGGSYKLTPTGYVFERVNIGAPLLWLPFYAAALAFFPLAGSTLASEATLQLWLNFSSWFYPIMGGILTLAALRRLFSSRILALTSLAILLGTPMLFYIMTFSFSAHPASIFLSALLLYLWLSDRLTHPRLYHFTLGIVVGWLMTVASYNIVFLALPGLGLLQNWLVEKKWRSLWQNSLATASGSLAGFLPQMLVWWFLFGSPFYSPYSGQLLWNEPYVLETLFSTFHGLFFYAPVLLLVIPGLAWSKDSWRAAAIGLAWLGLTYIVSINVAWWAGASFGNRYFLTLTPFFGWGLAAFIQKMKKWAVAPVLLCVLWTIGLYLQFLNGVSFTSDSIVFSAEDLARGQILAFTQLGAILPQLWRERPWGFVSWTILPTFILTLIIVSRAVYGWAASGMGHLSRLVLVGVSLVVILFIGLAGWRSEQVKAALTQQGFYNRPQTIVRREIKEFAGKAGLVTRAMYHSSIGQPEKAVADLQLASQLWQEDNAPAPQRLYLGPANSAPAVQVSLDLIYLGQARLIGYQLDEVTPQGVKGRLFWQKLAGEKSRLEIRPVVRAFNRAGALLGRVTLDFPFPAYYIPDGDFFQDSFSIEYTTPPGPGVWLGVGVAEDPGLPINSSGQPQPELIASFAPNSFLPAPLPASESVPPAQLLETRFARRYEPTTPQRSLVISFADAIQLAGYDFTIAPQEGQVMAHVVLHWHSGANVTHDYLVSVQLVAANEQVVVNQTGTPAHNTRPTSTWLKDEWLLDEHTLTLPPLPPGQYRLTLTLLDEQTGRPAAGQSGVVLQEAQIP